MVEPEWNVSDKDHDKVMLGLSEPNEVNNNITQQSINNETDKQTEI